MLRDSDIKNVSFRKAFVGGYKPEDVDAFVDNVQASFEQLLCENNNLMMTIHKMEQELRKFYNEESSIRTVIRDLKNVTDKSIFEAEDQARNIISKANKTSEEMLSKARKEVSLAKREVSIQEEISKNLKNESAKLKENLESIYAQHMRFLNQLPSIVESKIDTENEQINNNTAENDSRNTVKEDYKDNSSTFYGNFDDSVSGKQTDSYTNNGRVYDADAEKNRTSESFYYNNEDRFTYNISGEQTIPHHEEKQNQEYKQSHKEYNRYTDKADTNWDSFKNNKNDSEKQPLKFNILDMKVAGGSKYDGLHFGSRYKSTSILDLIRGKKKK